MNSRVVLSLGGIVVVAAFVIILVPQVSIQNAGSATLVAINENSVKGMATLSPFQGGQNTIVSVTLQQLAPSASYALAIRAGSCFGGLVAQLVTVSTDTSGNGSSSTTVTAQISPEWFIVLFNGPSFRDPVLACGRVVINGSVGPNFTPIIITSPTVQPSGTPNTPSQFPNTGGGPPK
jgi:hypothetical protein